MSNHSLKTFATRAVCEMKKFRKIMKLYFNLKKATQKCFILLQIYHHHLVNISEERGRTSEKAIHKNNIKDASNKLEIPFV